jgi:hypothetical protein
MVSSAPDQTDQFPGEPTPRRRVPAGQAILVALATLVTVLFLDADGLMMTAERQEQGLQRTVTVGIMRPIRGLSEVLGLTAPRSWVTKAAGKDQSTEFTSTKGVEIASRKRTDPATSGSAPGAESTTTTTTLPRYRTPSASEPLRVLVAGDSLSGYLGPSLNSALSGLPATVIPDQHVGTGLARPDVVDWPKELQQDMDADDPDVVVLFIGGNDDQDLRTTDGWLPISHLDEWKVEYQRRIAQIMDIVARPGVSVYWVGLPAMGKAHLNQYVPTINDLIETEAAARPHVVTYVDAGKALNGPDGGFATFLPDSSGKQVEVRAGDGVHPTLAGMNRIVALFAPDLIETRHLRAPPPPPPPTTATPTKTSKPATVGTR